MKQKNTNGVNVALTGDERRFLAKFLASKKKTTRRTIFEIDRRLKANVTSLNDAIVDMSKEVTVYANDAEVFRGVPERELSTLLLTGRYGDPKESGGYKNNESADLPHPAYLPDQQAAPGLGAILQRLGGPVKRRPSRTSRSAS